MTQDSKQQPKDIKPLADARREQEQPAGEFETEHPDAAKPKPDTK